MKEKDKIPMTKEEYQNLKIELENIISDAFLAHKNYEGNDIRDARQSLLWRINYLKKGLENAIIIEPSDDVIDIGDKITVLDDGEIDEITLVSYDGNALKKRISVETDFGKNIIGHKIGDIITYKTRADTTAIITVQILNIQKSNKEKDIVLNKKH